MNTSKYTLKYTYLMAMMGYSSLFGGAYYFTGNVPTPMNTSTEYVKFTYDSGQMDGYDATAYNSFTWYNLGSNVSDNTTYDDSDLLGDYNGVWDHQTSTGSDFVSLDSTLGGAVDEWISVGGKAVSLNSNITGEIYMALWGTSAALRIGNGADSAEVSFNNMLLHNDHDSILSVSEHATLNANVLEMDGSIHVSSHGMNPHMLFHVGGTANIGSLSLSSTPIETVKDSGVFESSESMVHIESTGHLKVDTLYLDGADSQTAVIMLDDGGVLELTDNSTLDGINYYLSLGGIFSASGTTLNVHDLGGRLYVTTLDASAIPEPSHVPLVMGLFTLLYLPLSARKVAI